MLSTNLSVQCSVIESTVRVCHEDIRRVIGKRSDCARSLAEPGANGNSAAGVSSGTSSYGANSGDAGVVSSQRRIMH